MKRARVEPLLWLLFSAGGMVAALLFPVLVLVLGLALPLGWFEPGAGHLDGLVSSPLTKAVLLGVCVLALFHWAHRFRFTLIHGLKLARIGAAVAVLCYGAALAGSVVAAVVLVQA